jgi:DNA-binding MarR family transcriptional regulator
MTPSKHKKFTSNKSFAKAFKQDIGRDKEISEEGWEIQTGKSLLMNPTRQKIFRYLCEYPCSSLSTIARDIQLSAPSTSWHLKLMEERKLIARESIGNQIVFFPVEMIEFSLIPILSLLTNPKINDIFIKIFESPGIQQNELTHKLGVSHQSINTFTNRMENEGLISIVKDGKFTRYYPTKKLGQLEINQRKKLKEFRKWLIKALKFDGVNPILIRATDHELTLQITSGKSLKSIKLSINPFISVIQNKPRFLASL